MSSFLMYINVQWDTPSCMLVDDKELFFTVLFTAGYLAPLAPFHSF